MKIFIKYIKKLLNVTKKHRDSKKNSFQKRKTTFFQKRIEIQGNKFEFC